MKKFFLGIFFLPAIAMAQPKTVVHTVKPKETLYSLARQYNIAPRELAAMNGLDINTGLQIGQQIKVPSTSTPVEQVPISPAKAQPVSDVKTIEAGNPVYHTVEAKETLYSISVKFGKVPVDRIKQWNRLSDNNLTVGQRLIVGFSADAPSSAPVVSKVEDNELPPTGLKNTSAEQDLAAQKAELERQRKLLEQKEQELKALEDNKANNDSKIADNAAAEAKQKAEAAQKAEAERIAEEKRAEAARKAELAAKQKQEEADRRAADRNTINAIAEQNQAASASPVSANTSPGKFSGGVFKAGYTGAKAETQQGTAGVFKSTSGWEDGKYYCLHNTAPIGSIIKIVNPDNNTEVYAKVLDVIPDLKANQDVIVRLSNAASAELGKGEANFSCSISY